MVFFNQPLTKTSPFNDIISLFRVKCKEKNLKFIIGVNIDLIEKLPNKGIKYLLIFVDPCEEVSNCKQNHEHRHCWKTQGSVTIYNKHNLIPQGTLGSSLHKSWNQLKQPSQKTF